MEGFDVAGVRVSLAPDGTMECVLPPDVARWFERAYEALRAGEFEVAEVGLRWMLLLAPDCALAHYLLATTLRYRNRPDLARLHAAEAARLGAIGQDRNDPRGAREL